MTKYTQNDEAWGECARSGLRTPLKDLVKDGYQKGIYVRRDFYDPPHPQEKLKPLYDPEMVRIQAPRLDVDVVNVTFPGYDITTGVSYGGVNLSFQTGEVTVTAEASALSLLSVGGGDWLVDSDGNSILV